VAEIRKNPILNQTRPKSFLIVGKKGGKLPRGRARALPLFYAFPPAETCGGKRKKKQESNASLGGGLRPGRNRPAARGRRRAKEVVQEAHIRSLPGETE